MENIEKTLKRIEQAGEAIGFDQKSDRKVGALLAALCASKPGGLFLELGTGCGLSTAWMAKGMDAASRLVTVDNDAQVLKIAKAHLETDERITFLCKQGEEVIDSMEKGSVDLIFADTWPGKYHHLEEALSLLNVGGIYVIDDMLPQENWPENHTEKVEALLEHLKHRDDFDAVQLDWATGVVIATKNKPKETNRWNPEAYNRHTAFVSRLALPVVDLLDPKPGERILDAGCGEGSLAEEIARRGARVVGVDLSREMVRACRARGIEADVASVTDLPFAEEFDAVFSNAVLHWVPEAKTAVRNIAKALKPGGRFVCEFGGAGNVTQIVAAMREVFARHPEFGVFENPWYFPTVEAYRELLTTEGLRMEYGELIPRPTPMDDVAHWLDIFANGVTAHLSREQSECFKRECREILKEKIYSEEEGWVIDYVRLRVKAVKEE